MTRSVDPLFDPRLADWLEGDDSTAPEQALEIVLASFPSIKQRRAWRVPWRTTSMTSTLRLGLAAAVVVAAALGGLYFLGSGSNSSVGGLETPTPSAIPSDTRSVGGETRPNWTSFTSPQYGYTIEYPSAYSAVPATEAWTGEDQFGPEESFVDRFFAPNGAAFVGLAALPKPQGVTDQEFAADYQELVAERGCPIPLDAWTDATVGGASARRAEFECQGSPGVEIIWIVGDTGFVMGGDAAIADLVAETFTVP
jgi:hypothetical protein